MDNLRMQRSGLAKAEADSYSPEYFPGSREWMANRRAKNALDAFDIAHPEIIEALRAERDAAQKRQYEGLSDFVKAGS